MAQLLGLGSPKHIALVRGFRIVGKNSFKYKKNRANFLKKNEERV